MLGVAAGRHPLVGVYGEGVDCLGYWGQGVRPGGQVVRWPVSPLHCTAKRP